jgi:hypothetical protein
MIYIYIYLKYKIGLTPSYISGPVLKSGFNFVCLTSFLTAGADYRYFDIDRTSGQVTIKRSIPEDELVQPATLVVRVRRQKNNLMLH